MLPGACQVSAHVVAEQAVVVALVQLTETRSKRPTDAKHAAGATNQKRCERD